MKSRPPASSPLSTARGGPHLHADERGLVIGFFVKLAVFLAIAAVVAIETGAVVWARFQAQDIADSAAVEAAARWRDTRSADNALSAAESLVADRDSEARLDSFEVQQDGTVTVVLHKEANTFLVQHIGFLEGFQDATGRGEASPPSI